MSQALDNEYVTIAKKGVDWLRKGKMGRICETSMIFL